MGAAQAVGRHNKAPLGSGDSSGAKVGDGLNGVGPFWATYKAGPFRSVTQADSAQERPQREAGSGMVGMGMAGRYSYARARESPAGMWGI